MWEQLYLFTAVRYEIIDQLSAMMKGPKETGPCAKGNFTGIY